MTKKFFLLITCLGYFVQVQASYVTCHIMGQLGNQLFEIATTLAYASDHDLDPIFPALHAPNYGIPYNWEKIFFRLDASPIPRPYAAKFIQPGCHSSEKIPFHPDIYLEGYFQSWKYFHHQREKILAAFAPSEGYSDYLASKYQALLEHPNTVAIHVRICLKCKHEANLHPFVGLDYYREAIQLFDEDALFVVFSDRISWCKRHFGDLCKNVVFIEGNDHIADLYLMSKMKNIIVGTSSFSWWGAYLNENPNKKVVVPNQWLHEKYIPCIEYLDDYYLPEWRVLPVTFGEYPDDVTAADRSTSIDDN